MVFIKNLYIIIVYQVKILRNLFTITEKVKLLPIVLFVGFVGYSLVNTITNSSFIRNIFMTQLEFDLYKISLFLFTTLFILHIGITTIISGITKKMQITQHFKILPISRMHNNIVNSFFSIVNIETLLLVPAYFFIITISYRFSSIIGSILIIIMLVLIVIIVGVMSILFKTMFGLFIQKNVAKYSMIFFGIFFPSILILSLDKIESIYWKFKILLNNSFFKFIVDISPPGILNNFLYNIDQLSIIKIIIPFSILVIIIYLLLFVNNILLERMRGFVYYDKGTNANYKFLLINRKLDDICQNGHLALFKKDLKYLLRNPMTLLAIIVGPLIIMMIIYKMELLSTHQQSIIDYLIFFFLTTSLFSAFSNNIFIYESDGIVNYFVRPIANDEILKYKVYILYLIYSIMIFAILILFILESVIFSINTVFVLLTYLYSINIVIVTGIIVSLYYPKSVGFYSVYENRVSYSAFPFVIGQTILNSAFILLSVYCYKHFSNEILFIFLYTLLLIPFMRIINKVLNTISNLLKQRKTKILEEFI